MAQVNDEISRQIFDDLDKQLDAQMMAELEKCQEEQSRQMDEELDRQVRDGEVFSVTFDLHPLKNSLPGCLRWGGAKCLRRAACHLIPVPTEAHFAFNLCFFPP